MARRPVTLAKLSRPRLHDVVPRTRLFSVLDGAARRPVVWLHAQPGAGKTSLVASYLEKRRRAGIWYQVDAGDGDPASFVYHLRLAADALPGRPPAGTLPLLTPEYLPDLRGFARRFFRDLFARLGDTPTLVLDNFQEAGEHTPFHTLLIEGLQQVPDGGLVIVASRAGPPPAYAPLIAADAVSAIDGGALRLTLPETSAIARRRGVADAADAERLQTRCNGWAAGLALLLARGQPADAAGDPDDPDTLQFVFGYFAQRVFDGLAAAPQRMLMQLAWLPTMTPPLATALCGSDDAVALLDQLYRRQLFVDRRTVAGGGAAAADGRAPADHAFQFHALFRTFLQHQSQRLFDADALRALQRRAATLLADGDQWEAALELHAAAGDWHGYGAELMRRAEALIGQGRQQSVADRLARMPAQAIADEPWLAYFGGRAALAGAPDRALGLLADAHRAFAERGDAAGQVAAGAAAIQSLWNARLGWSEIGPWITRLEPLLEPPPAFPSATIALISYGALQAALAFCRIAHPAIAPMARRLQDLIDDESIDWTPRLATATHLITYLHNAAEHDDATRLIARVDPQVDRRPAAALYRAFWYVFRAIHDIRQGNDAVAAALFERAERLASDEGLAHAEYAAIQFHAYLDVLFRRADAARARVRRLEHHPARRHPDAEMNWYFVNSMLSQLQGDVPAALAAARQGLEAIRRVGAEYFDVVFPPTMASVFVDAGEPGQALAIVARSRELMRGSYLAVMDAQMLLEEAYEALVRGDRDTALARLADGLARAAADRARAAYTHRLVARKPVLLVTALQAGIQPDFVRQLIRRWRIVPPAGDVPGWPWPVRVRTLGRFEVRVDDQPIEFGRKSPRKTLALLKAVIARGGSASEAALLDDFWRDEEADAAAKALGAAVHRLRGLLGDGDTVIQQGGRIALDRTRVWVDAWAFEDRSSSPRDDEDALALYQGAFLAEEDGETWPIPMRERLRSRFIQAVGTLAGRLEAARRDDEAIALYLRGLEADAVVEPFYQGLMRCYHRRDRLPEAVGAYRRLRQLLSVTLGLAPAAATERLYRSLRLDHDRGRPPDHE